ncbi:MAG: DoxX-like family protein [Candidatus Thiodiazotropha sp. (ex Epidulcina cf. delphinae)]|nr:DoxX-like family protein [Candidatus Thiodiazotropha sp. (ex Epidulcina cf. delphinae)]
MMQIARWVIGLSWIYHGLFPKLITIAPIENSLTSQIGLSIDHTFWLIKIVGVSEVLLGAVFIKHYKNLIIVYLNIIGLAFLLVLVAVLDATYLIEAFNPVTTNIPLIALSFVLLSELGKNHITK